MTATTGAPGFIEYYTLSDIDPIPDGFASLATSVNASLGALIGTGRQIQTFRWANQAAQDAQTGMQSGDEGWRIDTGVSYRRIGSAWVVQNQGYVPYSATVTGITTGSGTFTHRYMQVGKSVFVRGSFILGAGSAITGEVRVTLPVPRVSTADTDLFIGTASFRAQPSATYAGVVIAAGLSDCLLRVQRVSGSYTIADSLSPTVPFSWKATDRLNWFLNYEA